MALVSNSENNTKNDTIGVGSNEENLIVVQMCDRLALFFLLKKSVCVRV